MGKKNIAAPARAMSVRKWPDESTRSGTEDAGSTGLANASTVVVDGAPRPPRESGEKISDDGDGGTKAAEFLAAARLI